LEGSVTSQLEGQEPVNYHQGQYWYEPPNIGHLICKNLSNAKPAKLLVWQLIDDDAPALLPLSATDKDSVVGYSAKKHTLPFFG
jgi:quercetin dioxygenase-like cupin family protein